MVRLLMKIFGVALILSGTLWTLQGLGLVMWPRSSFMLDQRIWAAYGAIAIGGGLLLLRLGRKPS